MLNCNYKLLHHYNEIRASWFFLGTVMSTPTPHGSGECIVFRSCMVEKRQRIPCTKGCDSICVPPKHFYYIPCQEEVSYFQCALLFVRIAIPCINQLKVQFLVDKYTFNFMSYLRAICFPNLRPVLC